MNDIRRDETGSGALGAPVAHAGDDASMPTRERARGLRTRKRRRRWVGTVMMTVGVAAIAIGAWLFAGATATDGPSTVPSVAGEVLERTTTTPPDTQPSAPEPPTATLPVPQPSGSGEVGP